MRLAVLLSIFLSVLPVQSWATFEMAQTRIFFHSDQSSATAVLRNTGSVAAIYQINVTARDLKQGNPDKLTVFPSRFRLEAGQRQVIRIAFQSKKQVKPPQFFYLDILETSETQSSLSSRFVPIRFGIPIYYVDPNVKPNISYDLFRENNSERVVAVSVRNISETVVILNEVTLGGSHRFPIDAVLMPHESKVINPRGWQPPYVFEIRNFGLMEIK
jgi:P pilus assembly chaperone PapD